MDININCDDTTCQIDLAGEFTFRDNDMFRNLLNDLPTRSARDIQINLAQTNYIDSAALGMFLLLRDTMEENNMRLVLLTPKGQVKKMFDLSQFNTLFTIKE